MADHGHLIEYKLSIQGAKPVFKFVTVSWSLT